MSAPAESVDQMDELNEAVCRIFLEADRTFDAGDTFEYTIEKLRRRNGALDCIAICCDQQPQIVQHEGMPGTGGRWYATVEEGGTYSYGESMAEAVFRAVLDRYTPRVGGSDGKPR